MRRRASLRERDRAGLRFLGLVALALTSACSVFAEPVQRKIHGRLIEGQEVDEDVYAALMVGALAEQKGDLDQAEKAYRVAIVNEHNHGLLWARLGAVLCARSRHTEAKSAFEEGQRRDPEAPQPHQERARCLLAQGRDPEALAAAQEALRLDPADLDLTILIATIEHHAGHDPAARRWLDGLRARAPGDPRVTRAEAQLFPPSTPAPALLERLDQLLRTGSFDEAKRLSRTVPLSLGELSARAAALGALAFARDQATMVLAADPSSSDAFITLLVARSGDELPELLPTLHRGVFTPPSAVAVGLLAEVVRRRSGPEAAGRVLALGAVAPPGDALASELRARVEQAIRGEKR